MSECQKKLKKNNLEKRLDSTEKTITPSLAKRTTQILNKTSSVNLFLKTRQSSFQNIVEIFKKFRHWLKLT